MRKLTFAAVLLAFAVVVLGAYVRLTAAGLGCPDWPGCYGHVTPIGAEQSIAAGDVLPGKPFNSTKAWHEMIHRYAASTLGLLILLIAALALATRRESAARARFAVVLLGIVVLQGALGMLTVTWQLKPIIVTLHLLGGMTTLGLLWWLWLSQRATGRERAAAGFGRRAGDVLARRAAGLPPSVLWARRLAIVALVVLACQIALGGWTSSNYAAIACPDFPTCQGAWWPAMDFRHAFVFWRPLGIDYQGGDLSNPARVAIHFTHRLGALVTTCALVAAAAAALKQRALGAARVAAVVVLVALATQLSIGISMVLRGFPLPLATAHNAGAAFALLAVLALVHGLHARTAPS
ncbi:MAG: COX15/CtaA family protein [Steroidobacteraceae bacterium]